MPLPETDDLTGVANRLGSRLRTLTQVVSLPNSATSYALYVASLALICTGMLLHILLSSQLMQLEQRLAEIKAVHAEIEQRNADLIWKIAQARNIDTVQKRAVEMGYQPAPAPTYVVGMASPAAADAPPQYGLQRQNDRPAQPHQAALDEGAPTPTSGSASGRIAALLAYLRRLPSDTTAPAIDSTMSDVEPQSWLSWWRETRSRDRQGWSGFTPAWRFELPSLSLTESPR